MKTFSFAVALVIATLCPFSGPAYGQGTLQAIHITFDGPPPQPPGTGRVVQEYFESGMRFGALDRAGFDRLGGGVSYFPENGTAYIAAGLGGSVMFTFTNGALFDVISVDLAEFSTLYQEPLTVHFIGYRADGSTITVDLTTDGIIDGTGPLADFETFYFGPEWTGLTRVEIPTYGWSLDNLVVSIPEPSACALFLGGGLLLGLLKQRRNAKRPLVECASPCP